MHIWGLQPLRGLLVPKLGAVETPISLGYRQPQEAELMKQMRMRPRQARGDLVYTNALTTVSH